MSKSAPIETEVETSNEQESKKDSLLEPESVAQESSETQMESVMDSSMTLMESESIPVQESASTTPDEPSKESMTVPAVVQDQVNEKEKEKSPTGFSYFFQNTLARKPKSKKEEVSKESVIESTKSTESVEPVEPVEHAETMESVEPVESVKQQVVQVPEIVITSTENESQVVPLDVTDWIESPSSNDQLTREDETQEKVKKSRFYFLNIFKKQKLSKNVETDKMNENDKFTEALVVETREIGVETDKPQLQDVQVQTEATKKYKSLWK